MDLLQVRNINKKNERGFELRNITFNQSAQNNIVIAGETGSGKTTLLRIIAGLEQPDAGEIIFDNEKVIGPADKLIPGHKGIVYLSQQFELPHFLRVEQILEYANEWPEDKADNLFRLCRIEHLFRRRTDQLSGGEKQRIAIARLLIMRPELFLLDEPFSNMDLTNKNLLKKIISDISAELKISFIMVSHDPIDTVPWANEIIVLRDGEMIEKKTPSQIYSNPQFEYTAGLFGKYNLLKPVLLKKIFPELSEKKNSLKAMIRPENCVIVSLVNSSVNSSINSSVDSSVDSSLKGLVTESRYFGHYYETDVFVENQILITRSSDQKTSRGEQVFIRLEKDDIRFIT